MRKKIFSLLIAILCISGITISQDTPLVNKKGIPILPVEGDWGLGIDARPFTKIFNDNSDVSFNFLSDNTFMGKKFIKNNLAHRAKLRIGFGSNVEDRYIIQDEQTIPDPSITVTDTRTINQTNLSIGYGMERRSGYGRVQAVYGAEVFFTYESYSESYSYGNAFSMTNPNPSTTNYGNNIPDFAKRSTYIEDGNAYGAAIRAFIGIEYFIAAKMSIGGEFGWGIAYMNQAEGGNNVQSWDASTNNVKDEIYKSGGETYFGFDNSNFGGAIFFMFYFN